MTKRKVNNPFRMYESWLIAFISTMILLYLEQQGRVICYSFFPSIPGEIIVRPCLTSIFLLFSFSFAFLVGWGIGVIRRKRNTRR